MENEDFLDRGSQGVNLNLVIQTLGMKKKDFAASLQISHTLVSDMCSGKKGVQGYHLLLLETIHRVNPNFIRLGKGKMFLSGCYSETDSDQFATVETPASMVSKKKDENWIEIPFYEDLHGIKDFLAPPDSSFSLLTPPDSSFSLPTSLFSLFGIQASKKNLFAIRVFGDSMVPELLKGSVAFLEEWDGKFLEGEIYLFGYEGITYLKKLQRFPKEKRTRFLSSNPEYQPFDIIGEVEEEKLQIVGRVIASLGRV